MTRKLAGISEATAVAALVCATVNGVSAQPAAIDLRVNVHTADEQAEAAVAVDANENFVVVWESFTHDAFGQDGQGPGVFGRRVDPTGTPLGPEFQVNSYTTASQRNPSIGMRSSGEFVVVWQSVYQDGSFGGIFGQLFDASVNALGTEFQVNAESMNAQRAPAVAMDESGRFVVVWQGYTTGGLWDVWARQFDGSGNALGSDFVVNEYSTGHQATASVAVDAAGNFVVVWESFRPGDSDGVNCGSIRSFARLFDASGTPLGSELAVSSDTPETQAEPRVALTEGGHFMVAWQTSCSPSSVAGRVAARVFDASGTAVGPDITVDAAPTPIDPNNHLIASNPAVGADAAGNFVVAWHRRHYRYYAEYQYGEYDHQIRMRRYSSSGDAIDRGSLASTSFHPTRRKGYPAIAGRKPGRFIVAWHGNIPGGSYPDVIARSPDVIFSDGFETRDVSSWSVTATDGGDLTVALAASMPPKPWPAYGARVLVDDQASVSVQDDTPAAEPRYRARFYFDPNGFDPGEAVGQFRQRIFVAFSEAPMKRLVLLMVRRMGGQYALGAQVRLDDDTLAKPPFVLITDGPHAIEIDWQKATAAGANDGHFEMWIDGTSVVTVTGLDNDERPVDFVRMGAISVKAGASGTLYFDEFVSRRLAYIGP